MKKIILASESPRRASLLANLGLRFETLQPCIREELQEGLPPRLLAEGLARAKAGSVEGQVETGLIIAADTVVVLGDRILGKPCDQAEAMEMLASLSGRKHQVVTGVCLSDRDTGKVWLDSEVTDVYFRTLNQAEIEAYVETGEPADKAGAYGIQGKGALLVERIEGCFYNVVGLPLPKLYLMLKEVGISLL